MPVFSDMTNQTLQGSNYGFSAKRIEDLGATEYTLVGIACDASSSVIDFQNELELCIKEVVKACRRGPRADNLMMRTISFNSRLTEIHGFRPLSECDLDRYTGCIKAGGQTALFDAAVNLMDSVSQYGADLAKHDFAANGILVVVTDGEDNVSAMTMGEVRRSFERAMQSESLESLVSILIGVNVTKARLSKLLADFAKEAGFTQYVELGNATEDTLAKLGNFVSRSISAQSQALGTGGPSQSLSF